MGVLDLLTTLDKELVMGKTSSVAGRYLLDHNLHIHTHISTYMCMCTDTKHTCTHEQMYMKTLLSKYLSYF